MEDANDELVDMDVDQEGANADPVDMEVDMGVGNADPEDMDIDVFTEEDIIAEDRFLDDYLDRVGGKILEKLQKPKKRKFFGRRYILRPREAAHDDLFACYFSDKPIYTDEMFRWRFRMNRSLFLRIVEALEKWSSYFTKRTDCMGRDGPSPLQKRIAAIRMLAYGTPVDELDENLKSTQSTTLEILGKFAKGIIEVFGEEYLFFENLVVFLVCLEA
jgi:hypothetical protein